MKASFMIRAMRREEIDFAVDSAAREGWNPGLHDGPCFYDTDPEGFIVGCLGDRKIGCISAVSYENVFGFLGFYIVLPEYRGQGFGLKLWQSAMRRLDGLNVGLDGVIAQQENYQRSGFNRAYSNIRFEFANSISAARYPSQVVEISAIPLNMLAAFDRRFFPASRASFLKDWTGLPQSWGFAWIEDDGLRGYGVMRKCREGCKIGPLFADNPQVGEGLFTALCSRADPDEKIYLDAPDVNPCAMALTKRYDMNAVFGTARMYTRQAPQIDLDGIYGVTTFELG